MDLERGYSEFSKYINFTKFDSVELYQMNFEPDINYRFKLNGKRLFEFNRGGGKRNGPGEGRTGRPSWLMARSERPD